MEKWPGSRSGLNTSPNSYPERSTSRTEPSLNENRSVCFRRCLTDVTCKNIRLPRFSPDPITAIYGSAACAAIARSATRFSSATGCAPTAPCRPPNTKVGVPVMP